MKKEIKYWKGLEELNNEADFAENANNEFPEYLVHMIFQSVALGIFESK